MLRRRLRELEARVEALEDAVEIDYTMPARPNIGGEPVDSHGLWRERCADYSEIVMYDVDDDRASGVGVYI